MEKSFSVLLFMTMILVKTLIRRNAEDMVKFNSINISYWPVPSIWLTFIFLSLVKQLCRKSGYFLIQFIFISNWNIFLNFQHLCNLKHIQLVKTKVTKRRPWKGLELLPTRSVLWNRSWRIFWRKTLGMLSHCYFSD